jgi:D-sedoheptulose 7-phosphate isomerase
MNASSIIKKSIEDSIAVKTAILQEETLISKIDLVAMECVKCYENGGKILLCGNGGSAGDAQHIAAELSGRFMIDRPPLYAEALHVNSSFVTAVSNDYGYEHVFSRMVEAAGRSGDVLIAISTSGNSPIILRAIEKARSQGMVVIGMTGQTGGQMAGMCEILLNVPSKETPRIQESHILIGHILCDLIEQSLFPSK